MSAGGSYLVSGNLVAVITAVRDGVPFVLTTGGGTTLPAGPLQRSHRSMQEGMRAWVLRQTGCELGYIEQLYTFADRNRGAGPALEVSYLGLTTMQPGAEAWLSWYEFFPWEDRRDGTVVVDEIIAPALQDWVASAGHDAAAQEHRRSRCEAAFGLAGRPWHPDMTLARYELLYEAGLIPEAESPAEAASLVPGRSMTPHHRRILASGIARLRSKIQYQPVIFELLPKTFTLTGLQTAVEAIAGQELHTQNFRRLVAQQQLVEDSGQVASSTGGRPAKLVRFRRSVLDERAAAGTKLPIPRVK
ncbi:NUDIX hydrolase [Brevibacterium otitidis]|uniref:NrtR DNA-binding winged helix domain-containing protein n=1 Tax=Brevibacterium otitidis TaxID=53364 RepID=A0ABV5X1M2_9MICO|nr:membrane protein [Brevibacterium otitidis]